MKAKASCCSCRQKEQHHVPTVYGHTQEHHHAHGKSFPVPLAISVPLAVIGVLLDRLWALPVPGAIVLCAATLLSGYPVLTGGLKSLFRFHFDEELLMTIAVVAAACTGEFSEAALVTILFGIGEYIEGLAEQKSRRDIERLAEIRPDTAHLLRGGLVETVPAEQIVVGDRIQLHPHERVPLDGIVESGASTMDTSALTGESLPVAAAEGTTVLSGAVNGEGMLTIRVVNTFGDSAASRIIAMVSEAAERKGTAEKFITRFSSIYTPIVVVLAILLVTLPPLFGWGAFSDWFHRGLVFLVASCPCALVISVPLSFFAGSGTMAKHGLLVKGGKYLEAISRADAVVFDKTGTLTSGALSVEKAASFGSYDIRTLLGYAAGTEQFSTHPAAKAVLAAARTQKAPDYPLEKESVKEIGGYGVSATVDGHTVLCGQRKLMEQNNIPVTEGYSVYIAVDGKTEGALLLSDTPRVDAAACIEQLQDCGVRRVVMLTGDNRYSAQAAAQKCGVEEYYAELLPADKLELLQKIRGKTGKTLFVGDGINDAPSLAAADCGIAMGFGTDAAAEAADAVLASQSLCRIPEGIRIARRVMRTVRSNIIFALAIKFAVLILAACGFAPMWAAVFADVGVTVITVLHAAALLK